MEMGIQFLLPLLYKVGRAENGETPNLTTVQEFPDYEQGFYGFADTHIVGDKQPDGLLFEGHHEGDKLVSFWFYGDTAEAAERPGAVPELELEGVPKQQG